MSSPTNTDVQVVIGAGFITGTDLLCDGGVIAALRAGRWQFGG